MRILAIETATLTASVAVVRIERAGELGRGGALPATPVGRGRSSRGIDVGRPIVLAEGDTETGTHSERLMPLVAEMCERAGLGAGDLDAFAVGAGPGSFTGLRIGLATAKGLAFATGKPLWLVSSLAALAWAMHEPGFPLGPLLVPALDARRGELYAGFYRVDEHGVPRAVAPERVMPPAALAAAIDEVCSGARLGDSGVVIAGDALVTHAAALAALPSTIRRRTDVRPTPPAAGVAIVAAAGDRADGLAHGAPAYLRPSEAEVKYPDGIPGARRKP